MRLSFSGNPSAQAQVEAALRERLPGQLLCGAASAPPGLGEPPWSPASSSPRSGEGKSGECVVSWKPREERVSRRGWDSCVECYCENKNSDVNIRFDMDRSNISV